MSIYQALRDKLGRFPTNDELRAEIQRIKGEALIQVAMFGKFPRQRRRRHLAS